MSSSSEEKGELKAGHGPAVKAGGMRIVQHKQHNAEKPAETLTAEEMEFPKSDKKNQTVIVSGVLLKDRDFTNDSAKLCTEKPAPVHEKRPMKTQYQIQQPRK